MDGQLTDLDAGVSLLWRRAKGKTGGTELLYAIRSAECATLNDLEATVETYQLRSYGGE